MCQGRCAHCSGGSNAVKNEHARSVVAKHDPFAKYEELRLLYFENTGKADPVHDPENLKLLLKAVLVDALSHVFETSPSAARSLGRFVLICWPGFREA